jgi:hypothetical protein
MASMSLSIEDILDDLAKLQRPESTTHPILSLGNSLLPPNLQSEKKLDTARQHSGLPDHSSTASRNLEEVYTAVDQSQAGALHLSSVYLDSTRKVLALNQDRDRQESTNLQQQETGGLFDKLHRRVAQLQSSNEGFRNKLQEVRQVIVELESK